MANLNISINLDNAAFEDDTHTPTEIERLLNNIANTIGEGDTKGWIIDYNGNTVGQWSITNE